MSTNTFPATTLGYAQITSNFTTTSASSVQVTSLSATVTISSTSRRVLITAFSRGSYNNGVSTSSMVSIWDGTVGSGTQISSWLSPSAVGGAAQGMNMMASFVPASTGSKTYNIGLQSNGTATATIEASSVYPAFILVQVI